MITAMHFLGFSTAHLMTTQAFAFPRLVLFFFARMVRRVKFLLRHLSQFAAPGVAVCL
jgi:hypothetical protein